MKLSRYFHCIKLNEEVSAIYNSLIMDVFYVNNDKLREIFNMKIVGDELDKLKSSGIIIDSEKQDDMAIQVIKDRYNKVTGKIQIMYLILSSSCNLACKYCFIENGAFNNKIEKNMKVSTGIEALRKYAKYIKGNGIEEGSIIFYGGEPLVNFECIKAVLSEYKKLDVKINFSMVTNATLLDEEKVKFLTENDVEIGISIDGPKELNDRNRIYRSTHKSVYDEVINKFSNLNMYKTKYGLSITVSEEFLKHQDEVLEWLEKLGVTSIFYNLYHYTNYDGNWKNYYEKASKFIQKSYVRLRRHGIYDGRLKRKIDSIVNNEFKFSDCGAIGGNQITVKPNGDVCVCHGYFKTNKYVIGNILSDSIDKMSKTEEMRFWKERSTLNNSKCLKCESLFICGGGCAIQAEALFGSRSSIDKPFCMHTKSALYWILRECYKNSLKEKEYERV